MQNKGFVILISSLLVVICAYYLSFTPVVRHYDNKAAKITAQGGDGLAYIDSMASEKVWMGQTLKKARTQQIGLGLDLKGGMNVVLKVNGADLLSNLSGHNADPNFIKALEDASKVSASNFVDAFTSEYKKINPDGQLAVIFSNGPLREEISPRATNNEVIKILKDRYTSAIDASLNVLRTRIDRFGVVAPNIQKIEGEGRILVEMPGVKDPERVRDLLQKSANLQFWKTYTYDEVSGDLNSANSRLSAMAQAQNNDSTTVVENVLFSLLTPMNRGTIVGSARRAHLKEIDQMLAEAKSKGWIREDLKLMWGNEPIVDPQTRKETDIYELYAIRGNRSNQPDLSGEVVTSAKSEVRNDIGHNGPVVTMKMNDEGARQWARLTKDNIGRSIAIALDGVVYSAPNVNSEITGGSSEISGSFTVEQTTDLANVLNSGKMEAGVIIEQENVVGPTLGHESIQAGIISFIIALILLAVYMCLAYGLIPGLIADLALVVNSFLTLGILASFHSVLTLSGIAGLVLTLGMAVDANVLIFERIKEEIRAGKSKMRAIQDGYNNAFSAIFDSNLTTVITGVVLYTFGTGPIRGFATTLIIGIVCSFITAVFLTRIVVEALAKKGKMEKVNYSTAMTRNLLVDPNFNIIGSRKRGLGFTIALIILGIVGSFTVGLNRGIDFSGGRNFIVKFDQKVNTEEVREALTMPLEGKVVVTTIGTDGDQVRIATNYDIENNTQEAETNINKKMYDSLKEFYKNNVSQSDFINNQIVSSQKVSASMSKDITNKAVIAVIISLIFMAAYILIRFRNIAFSLGALASVSATTFMIISTYILLWRVMPFTMEIDQNFIAAILAIIGYSINDVVVVFDRIRETKQLYPNRDTFSIFNGALNSTLSRTMTTSLTTFIVIFVIFLLGGASMRSFTFAILLGVLFGTFATLFVASPIAYLVAMKQDKKNA